MEINNVKLTPELKARLQGYLGFSPEERTPYVPKVFRERLKNEDGTEGDYAVPKELWPVFYLKGKKGVDMVLLDDLASCQVYDQQLRQVVHRPKRGAYAVENVRRHLDGWKNFRRLSDLSKEVPWNPKEMLGEDGMLTQRALDELDHLLIMELCDAIDLRSHLTEEELMGLGS